MSQNESPYQVRPASLSERLKVLSPFGLGHQKPKHFRDMGKILWDNRDNLGYAWKVISQGVCDGCALGVAGLHDWTIPGVHLCMTRLNLLRLNTMPAMDPAVLADVSALRGKDNRELRNLGRLAYPMLRRKGEKGFTRISWEEANTRIAKRIRSSTPDRLAFYLTARGITNEVYYVAQKVVRFLGTNNIDNAARLCHSPSTAAMKSTLGVAASTCSYTDWFGTDLLIFFGSNPANDQPVATKYLDRAKAKGTKVVMVNPYLEPGMKRYWVPSLLKSAVVGTPIADYWYPVAQGGDIAFLYGVLKVLFENDWINRDFIANHTTGVDSLREACSAQSWETIEQRSGIDRDGIRQFAEMIRDAKNAVLVWSMGITQHAFGADAVQMILNLGLVRGYVGRDLNGLMPIRGHSGVQGGAEMGAYATAYPGGKPVNAEYAAKLSATYGFDVPSTPGLTSTEMVEACERGNLDLLYCMGGNFLRALPDPEYVTRAMANVPMRVHQDIILTDQMLIDSADEVLLLPAQTRYEQEGGGTSTTTERRIAFTPVLPRQVGEAKAEWRILLDIAHATYPDRADVLRCQSGQEIREEIAKVVPSYDGIQNLTKTGDAIQYGGRHLCPDGVFATADGKAHIRAPELPVGHRKSGTFKVSTRRGKQFNTLVYADVDPLNGAPRDGILMNPEDAAKLHLVHGDRVRLLSEFGQYDGRVHLAPISRGDLQVHWPEGNVLLATGPKCDASGCPDYNAGVRVERI